MKLPFMHTAEELRAMYAGRRGNPSARRYARFWSGVFATGLFPRRWVTLVVPGRRSGQPTRFPLGRARVGESWYLVSMLGECNWVKNVRAAQGHVRLLGRAAGPAMLVEVPVRDRPPIIKEYLRQVPGGRPHIPVDKDEPESAFAPIAETFPVFRIDSAAGGTRPPHG